MAISITPTPSPTNPQRSDPLNFRQDADQYVNWHTQDFVPELTQIITDLNATIQNLWVGTSATSVTIATGSKSFTMAEDNLAFGIGNHVRVANTAAPTSYYMSGIITAYNKTTKVLTVNVLTKTGTATKNAWTIVLEPPDEYNRVKTWASMTGAASIPLVVDHGGVYYGLNTNLADVTAKTPGVDTEWTPFGAKTYQEFTASGTWVKPPGCSYVFVQCISGGSSGSAIIASGSSETIYGGAGGLCFENLFLASDLAAEETVVVGSGGAAKTITGTSVAYTAGNIGGASSFGSFAGVTSTDYTYPTFSSSIATGSSYRGGNGRNNNNCCLGGAGGGYSGHTTGGVSQVHGNGGNASITTNANATGVEGTAPGGGGGGAGILNNVTSHTAISGAGARGCVRVWTW